MKKGLVAALFFILSPGSNAQLVLPVSPATEQQLEDNASGNRDTETEDDAQLQKLYHYTRSPLNLNEADETQLLELQLLSPLQVRQFIQYRELLGKFLSIYELQAIPGWDLSTLEKVRLYVTVSDKETLVPSLLKRFTGGEHSVLARVSRVLERAEGYRPDTLALANKYLGSPEKLFIRYKYNYANSLQYGILAEKDAGEQLFKGGQKSGFDFYSAHFFARNLGLVRSLAVGDFTVNMGQGLIQWQGLAFGKSADVLNIKRQAAVLQPYNSAGESNFHRGAGITFAKNRWEATAYVSYRKLDANKVIDTTTGRDVYITALQNSGYHRTISERADQGVLGLFAYGAHLSWHQERLTLGLSGILNKFGLPFKKAEEPYNTFSFSGNSLCNFSFDYGYTYKNLHLFGEAAFTGKPGKAILAGMLVSTSFNTDISLLYRNLDRSYQSLYASAFTENSFPGNEKGIFTGISLHPGNSWRIDAYADLFRFPWLKYRVDKPTNGYEFLIQASYTPNKMMELFSKYSSKVKDLNVNPEQLTLSPVITQSRQQWRTQFSLKVNESFIIKSRVEIGWSDRNGNDPGQGFLGFLDLHYKPPLKSYSAGLRMQYFETEGYNNRIYAFENDILFSYSIPAFYDKGFKYYINITYKQNKKLTLWMRWAQNLYRDKSLIGSGLDEIPGNKKSEFKVQVMYKF